jgi:3-hydroxyacyl-[acyl-carrier-protein] dehydratase
MRWFWIDRFTSFESGNQATAIKNVALDEEALDDYHMGFPFLPNALIIEGLAQLGGVLIGESIDFAKPVVLAKVVQADFYAPARPGDQLQYHATIESVQGEGGMVSCTSHLEGNLQAEVRIMFAFLGDDRFGDKELFRPTELSTMLRLMGFYEVALDKSGDRIPHSSNRLVT